MHRFVQHGVNDVSTQSQAPIEQALKIIGEPCHELDICLYAPQLMAPPERVFSRRRSAHAAARTKSLLKERDRADSTTIQYPAYGVTSRGTLSSKATRCLKRAKPVDKPTQSVRTQARVSTNAGSLLSPNALLNKLACHAEQTTIGGANKHIGGDKSWRLNKNSMFERNGFTNGSRQWAVHWMLVRQWLLQHISEHFSPTVKHVPAKNLINK